MGCAVLPHLKSMVDIIRHGLTDENQKVGETYIGVIPLSDSDILISSLLFTPKTAWPSLTPLSQVKTITSLSLAALAEAAAPYGIESFDETLEPLWRGIRSLRGKV